MQIVVPNRKQASANLAIGSDTNAAAVSTEGMRDRRDDAGFSNAIVEAIAASRFAAGGGNFYQRLEFGHSPQDFITCNHAVRRPHAAFFKRHEFDEADNHVLL